MKHFFIFGNGGGGTTLMQGLMNAHPKINCQFEVWTKKSDIFEDKSKYILGWVELTKERASKKITYGNKIPLEQFFSKDWNNEQIAQVIDYFYVLFIIRRFSKYNKKPNRLNNLYKTNWQRAHDIYWLMREKHPDKIIQISFEDLVLRPVIELIRICNFLDITYTDEMLKGTGKTALDRYNYNRFVLEKV